MLKLIAPFRVLFNLDSSLIAAHPAEFTEFLKRTRRAIAEPDGELKRKIHAGLDVEINLPVEAPPGGTGSRYTSLDATGSQYVSPKVMTVRFASTEQEEIRKLLEEAAMTADRGTVKYSQLFRPDVQSLSISFYDNSIAILSLELPMDRARLDTSDHAWDGLDKWTTQMVHYFLSDIYPRYLFPLVRAITKFCQDANERYVLDVWQYKVFLDLVGDPYKPYTDLDRRFMLMWVNRTLFYRDDFPANQWIRPCRRENSIIRLGEAQMHLNWGNNLIILPQGMTPARLSPLWDGMLSAQYYYAAMDAVSLNLVKYIGVTFNRQTSKMLRRLSNDMEIIVNSVTILQVRYKDISMEVQGIARDIFHHLEREWHFETLADNVQMKIDLCKSNITSLNQETSNRNQGRMEVVLTALAGMSVLNLVVELCAYAVQTPQEDIKMVGKFPGFMSLPFLVSHNTLAWIGICFGLAVVVFAIKNRSS